MSNLSKYDATKDKLLRFNAPEEYLDWLCALPRAQMSQDHSNYGLDFYGLPIAQALNKLQTGDTSNVDAAARIIDQMSDQEVFSVGMHTISHDFVGALPSVPAALMGHPKHMLRRVEIDMPAVMAPIAIYYDATVSQGVPTENILKRGVATLALTMAFNLMRTVELYVVCAGDPNHKGRSHGACVKVETKPLDLARACFMLTSNTYCRRLAFGTMCHGAGINTNIDSVGIGWSWGNSPSHGSDVYEASFREAFDMQPHDIFLKGGHIDDSLMLSDPVAWVKQMIAEHSNQGELV